VLVRGEKEKNIVDEATGFAQRRGRSPSLRIKRQRKRKRKKKSEGGCARFMVLADNDVFRRGEGQQKDTGVVSR
jgi:hypothetical protein